MREDEIVYGLNPAKEALSGSRRAFELFIAGQVKEKRLERLLLLAAQKGVPVRHREKRDLDRLCGTDHHQGVAVRMEAFGYADLEEVLAAARASAEPGLVLLLDGIQDPHNLGALIRSAACAGAHGVVIPRDRAAGITAVVEKTSAGAVETIPVAQVTNLVQTVEELKNDGFWIYGLCGETGSSLYDNDFTGKVALVVGSEGEGIRPLVRKSCDVLAAIPLRGGVSSLNASVAGAIALFEVVRQRLRT